MKKKPLITIITPTFNRAKYLKKLRKSIANQTFTNFEWIIGDDGSTDNTQEVIMSNKKNYKNIKITYLKSKYRIGKARMDNIIIKRAKGKYLTTIGSDDYFSKKSALEDMLKLIKSIPKKKEKFYNGVITQCIDENNISQSFHKNKIPKKNIVMKYEDSVNYLKGDATILEFTSGYKNKKYLEVDLVITESSMLSKIYKNKLFIISPIITKIMYRAKDSISFGKKIQYCRASAYSFSESYKIDKFKKLSFKKKILTIFNYWRYCFHGDIKFSKAINLWVVIKKNYYSFIIYPFSFLMAFVDYYIRKKVEKTHLIFEQNKNKNDIQIYKIN